jgi:hypothetical protein
VVETVGQKQAALESCEMCSEPIPPEHRHLLNVSTREIMCVCRPCSILFDKEAASEGKYRLVPERRLLLEDFEMSDVQWASLRIPVDMAFFFYSTPVERVAAFYPSPMGPTESLLDLGHWEELESPQPGTEGDGAGRGGAPGKPVRGSEGALPGPHRRVLQPGRPHPDPLEGPERRAGVWEEIDRFFEVLKRRSKKVGREG